MAQEAYRLVPDVDSADLQAFRQVAIFRDVDGQDLRGLVSVARCRVYRRHEMIVGPDDEPAISVFTAGGARLSRVSPSGQEVTLEYVHAPDIFGVVFVNAAVEPKGYLVATADGTLVYRISRHDFLWFLSICPSVAVRALSVVAGRLAEARDQIGDLTFYSMKTRLAHTLAKLGAADVQQTVWETHEELAWMVGTRQEEVTKALRQLRDRELVAYQPHRRGITVLNVPGLATYGTE